MCKPDLRFNPRGLLRGGNVRPVTNGAWANQRATLSQTSPDVQSAEELCVYTCLKPSVYIHRALPRNIEASRA
jgi:hypothetical protein